MGKKSSSQKAQGVAVTEVAKAPVEADGGGAEAPAPSEAEAAYAARKEAWKQRGGVELGPPRANIAFVAARVIQIAKTLAEPATLAAFDALGKVPLPGGPFDAGAVRLLPVVGKALWYARSQYLTADAQSATVSLAPALVNEATDVRGTMFKVIEYNCVDDKKADDPVAADLVSIRAVQGPRYLDLATDLSRLAAYYRNPAWLPVLQADARRFDPKHAVRAEELAAQILEELHKGSDAASRWLLEIYRGWSELQAVYDVARRGAAFVFWGVHDEVVPPLGALRPAVSQRKAPEKKPA